jgi:hypothetical protein
VFVTVAVTVPAECDVVVQVMLVELTTVTEEQLEPPKLTVAPDKKSVPVIVTLVPPPREPAFGETLVTVGAPQ